MTAIFFLTVVLLAGSWLLFRAFEQNRGLAGRLRGTERSLPTLLRDAFLLWSPLGGLVLVLALAAARLADATVSLAYEVTTLDEFCAVSGLRDPLVIPCTGMGDTLAPQAIRRAGIARELDEHVATAFADSRRRWLSLSPARLATLAANRPAFYRALSPQGVLGLESAPENDHELARLKGELRQLLRTPTPPARNVMDVVRFVTEREARVQRLRALTALVLARRELVNQAAFQGLERKAQGRLWWRHRLSQALAQVEVPPDPVMDRALARLAADPEVGKQAVTDIQRGIAVLLARGEAAALDQLSPMHATRKGTAGLRIALAIEPRCTAESPDNRIGPGQAVVTEQGMPGLLSNGGTFACPAIAQEGPLPLRSLGFRASVGRSIDRWHASLSRDSVRRLGRIAASPDDAASAARSISQAVPGGIDLGRSDCGWLAPANCAANAARSAIEEGFSRLLVDVSERYDRAIDTAKTDVAAPVTRQVGDRLLTLDAELADLRIAAHDYAGRFFLAGTLLGLLGWLAVALIVMKSFLYVLALEVFHDRHDMRMGFENAAAVQGSYRIGRRLTIDRGFPVPLVTRKQLSNADNHVRLAPWPWSAPIGRILRGRYFVFTRGRFLSDATDDAAGENGARGMVASAGGGLSIVEWVMQPGEQVMFRYKDFFGASENVRLRSEISLRLSTLLLGRIVFRYAECIQGEGRLLLKADVEDIDQHLLRAVPPERLIAWNRQAQFSVNSGRTLWKTLLNGYTLVRRERPDGASGLILVSSDDIGSNLGSIRFVQRIFRAVF